MVLTQKYNSDWLHGVNTQVILLYDLMTGKNQITEIRHEMPACSIGMYNNQASKQN